MWLALGWVRGAKPFLERGETFCLWRNVFVQHSDAHPFPVFYIGQLALVCFKRRTDRQTFTRMLNYIIDYR